MSVPPPPPPLALPIFSFLIFAICAIPIAPCIPACISPNGAGMSANARIIDLPVKNAVSAIAKFFCSFSFLPPNALASSNPCVSILALKSFLFCCLFSHLA